MGKRRRRQKVYYNSNTDTITDDTREQLYLLPTGSSAESSEAESEREATKRADVEHNAKERAHNASLIEVSDDKDKIQNAYNYATGRRKYKRYMDKDVQTADVQRIAENGLDRDVPKKDFHDELYDDGISGDDYKQEALSDYREELCQKEIPVKDTDKDGDVDEDDVMMTPGMKTMKKYM